MGQLRPEVLQVIVDEAHGEERSAHVEDQESPWQFYHSSRRISSLDQEESGEGEGGGGGAGGTGDEGEDEGDQGEDDLQLSPQCVFFADWVMAGGKGKETLSRVMNEMVRRWRDEGKFSRILGGE